MTNVSPSENILVSKLTNILKNPVTVPGSKSLTNRALVLAALSKGQSTIRNVLLSDDTRVMIDALKAMGINLAFIDATTLVVESEGTLSQPNEPLYLGNAGTATRFLTAVCALVDGIVVIDGDKYMQKRPISPLVEALKMMGISIECPTGCPPVTMTPAVKSVHLNLGDFSYAA